MLGAFLVSKIKLKNNMRFFILCNVLVSLSIFATVFIKLFYVSVIFFLIHVVLTTSAQVASFTYLNTFLQDKIRTTVLSIYYACEAIFTVAVMELNSLLLNKFDMGNSWVILTVIGLILLFVFAYKVKRKSLQI